MAFSLARIVTQKTVPKLLFCASFSSTANGDKGDDGQLTDDRKLQNQLKKLHTYETINDPKSLVKTIIIKRNSILQSAKTPEQILQDAADAVAKNNPKQVTKENSVLTKSRHPDATEKSSNDFEKNVHWGHDGNKGIVGYDILQELEERLQEILTRNEEITNPTDNKTEKEERNKKNNDKLSKISNTLDGINRLLSFYLLRSYLYQKHW